MQGFRELIQLHLAHEAERSAAEKQEALRRQLAGLESAIAEAEAALQAAEADVKRLHLERKTAELDVQKLEDTRRKYRDQLMGAKTNEIYKTLLHEIETSGAAISTRETVVLEILEAADAASRRVAEAKRALAAAQARRAEEEKSLAGEMGAHEADRVEAQALARTLEASVPASLLSHYQRIREARGGRGMSLAVERECTECRVAVRPQAWVNLVVLDEPYQCFGCKRFLYRKENLAPVGQQAPTDAEPAASG